jgi:hypothetical protein
VVFGIDLSVILKELGTLVEEVKKEDGNVEIY